MSGVCCSERRSIRSLIALREGDGGFLLLLVEKKFFKGCCDVFIGCCDVGGGRYPVLPRLLTSLPPSPETLGAVRGVVGMGLPLLLLLLSLFQPSTLLK